LTYLPAAIGGVLFAGLADRYPRRRVMVACDVARCGLLAAMAVPGVPLPVVAILLVAATGVGAVFKAAEPVLIADLISGEPYAAAVGLRATTFQVGQLVGFAVGGSRCGARCARSVSSGLGVVRGVRVPADDRSARPRGRLTA
jgi:predicted MFS family arabinose efflux permease